MKAFIITLNYSFHYLIIKKNGLVTYTRLDDDFYANLIEDKTALYSSDIGRDGAKKNDKKVKEVLGESIFSNFDFRSKYEGSEMIYIFTFLENKEKQLPSEKDIIQESEKIGANTKFFWYDNYCNQRKGFLKGAEYVINEIDGSIRFSEDLKSVNDCTKHIQTGSQNQTR